MAIREVRNGKDKVASSALALCELEVLVWVANGKRAYEIAELLQCKTSTVQQRIYRIMNKLGAATSAGAVAVAIRTGIIT